MKRRTFLRWSAAGLGAAAAPRATTALGTQRASALEPMTAGIVPITDDERKARLEKARRLMTENGIGAI